MGPSGIDEAPAQHCVEVRRVADLSAVALAKANGGGGNRTLNPLQATGRYAVLLVFEQIAKSA